MRIALIVGFAIGAALILRHMVTPPADVVRTPGTTEVSRVGDFVFDSQTSADLAVDQWQRDMDAYLASAEFVG